MGLNKEQIFLRIHHCTMDQEAIKLPDFHSFFAIFESYSNQPGPALRQLQHRDCLAVMPRLHQLLRQQVMVTQAISFIFQRHQAANQCLKASSPAVRFFNSRAFDFNLLGSLSTSHWPIVKMGSQYFLTGDICARQPLGLSAHSLSASRDVPVVQPFFA